MDSNGFACILGTLPPSVRRIESIFICICTLHKVALEVLIAEEKRMDQQDQLTYCWLASPGLFLKNSVKLDILLQGHS